MEEEWFVFTRALQDLGMEELPQQARSLESLFRQGSGAERLDLPKLLPNTDSRL